MNRGSRFEVRSSNEDHELVDTKHEVRNKDNELDGEERSMRWETRGARTN